MPDPAPAEGGIACLVPAATDLVVALGCGERIVAVSHECDDPSVQGRPVVTSTSLPTGGRPGVDPAAVDTAVRAALAAGTPLYRTDTALLEQLVPVVVVGQDVCDVCAVDRATAAAALPAGSTLVTLTGASLAGLAEDLRRLGEVLGVPDRAEELVAGLAGLGRGPRPRGRPLVAVLEWAAPPMIAGHWVPELVLLAGGQPVLVGEGEPSRRVTWAELAAARPAAVVHAPCGYDADAAAAELSDLLFGPLGEIAASASLGVFAVDASRWFSRLTPASVEGALGALAAVLGD